MENETEDEILARALEESLRHYRDVELPRLTQIEPQTSNDKAEGAPEELDCVDVWEEWDDADIENAVQIEDAVEYGEESTVAQTSHEKAGKSKGSSKSMDDFIHKEVLPRQSYVSVGESGHDGADGFDKEAGRMWIYPCNFPVRKYQLDIVHSALFDNTLVCLPTGLGKTFIAAVVMYNFYRWFPSGKIIFLAPTRPLVAQQIHACYSIMGIPPADTAELTGSKAGIHRAKAWKEKRVFFATPQVLANDLGTGVCPGELVRCIVVDEAHRAAGNHAICQSFRSLFRLRDRYPKFRFRVVALSATPGRNPNAVAGVVSALQISKLELRDELSPDVAPYTHRRNLETVVVPLGPELCERRDKLMEILDGFVDRLIRRNVLYCKQKSKLTKFQLLLARENFRKNVPPTMNYSEKGLVEGDFATCITLVHALGLLLTHGERTFMSFIQAILNGDKGSAVVKIRLSNNIPLLTLLQQLQEKLGDAMLQPAPNVSLSEGMAAAIKGDNDGKTFIPSHPKMDHLRDIVVKHFESFQASGDSTRVMIFCEFRDPVVEICNMLMQHWPLVKPMSFVGQSSSIVLPDQDMPGPSRGTKGFTQKQQLQVIRGFREGGYNVLVSTCVGEEGLDIGEVDLIVCYDAPHASPLRLVQRMGRTGRKREGRVVTLVTEEIEEQKHRQGLRQKSTIVKSLLSSKMLETSLCRNHPRVLPPDAKPSCHMMPLTIPKLPGESEKNNKKVKSKSEKTISVKDMLKKGGRKEVEGEETSVNDVGETSSHSSKRKVREKSLKHISKVKPKKGIKEFFNAQKAKVLDTIVLSDEDPEDDDFIGVRDTKTKASCDENENCDEIAVMEEDMPFVLHSPPLTVTEASSVSKLNCQVIVPDVHKAVYKEVAVFSEALHLPSDLLALENSLSLLFVNLCCDDVQADSPHRCSVIMSHFKLRHSEDYPRNIWSVFSFDSITTDALNNFDVEKEAAKIGAWTQKPVITACESNNQSLVRNYGPFSEKYNFLQSDHMNGKSLTSLVRPSLNEKKGNLANEESSKSSNNDVKTVNNFCNGEVIEILDSDEEKTNYTLPSNKKPQATTSGNTASAVREGLLWNVCGKREQIDVRKSIGSVNESGVLEKDDLDFKKASHKTSLCVNDNVQGIGNASCNDGKTDDMDSIMALEPPYLNGKLISSPDLIEDGYFGSQERTPKKDSLKMTPVGHDDIALQEQPVLASSTPKVHRRNLFSPQTYLPSPIDHRLKRSSDKVKLSPVNENFAYSHQPSLCHGSNFPQRTPSPQGIYSNLLKTKAQVGFTYDKIEYPNFDLGSEFEFSSSDETVFEPEVAPDQKKADNNGGHLRSVAGERDEGKVLSLESNLSEKDFCREQSRGLMPPKIEISSDIFENTSAEISKTMSSKNKLSRQVVDTCGGIYNHSFTITQAVNMLVPSEGLMVSNEEKKSSDRKMVEFKAHDKNKSDEVYFPSKVNDSFLINECEGLEGNKKLCNVEEKSSSPKENVPSLLKNKSEKISSIGSVKKDVDVEINFEIGDDILLDLSDDLFAEDDGENEEKIDDEAGLINLVQVPSCRTPEVDVSSNGEGMSPNEFTEEVLKNKVKKRADKEVCRKSQVLGGGNEVHADEAQSELLKISLKDSQFLAQKSHNDFPVNEPGIPGWDANGWLSKGTYSNKSKFSLGLKSIKRQMGSTMPSEEMNHIKCKNTKADILEADEVASKPSTSVFSKRDNGWIDDIGTDRTILEALDDLQRQKHLCQSHKAALSKEEELIPCDRSLTCLEFEDPDLFKNIDCQPKQSLGAQHKNSKKEVLSTVFGSYSRAQKRSEEFEVEGTKRGASKYHDVSLDESQGHKVSNNDSLAPQRKDSSKEVSNELDSDLSDLAIQLENNHKSVLKQSESSSDDFADHGTSFDKKKRSGINTKDVSISSEEQLPIRPRRVRRKRSHQFLDTQAEESFTEVRGARRHLSDDDEEDDDGRGESQYYDPSFINDGGHNSQETEVDMHAKYLQSVRSPRNAKFKIPNLKLLDPQSESELEEQVFHNEDPDSYYMNDSFCVDSNGEEKEESVDELEVLEAILANSSKSKKVKKRKKEKDETSSDEQLETYEVKRVKKGENGHRKKCKRKRIVVHDSSEEEENHLWSSPNKRRVGSEAEIPIIDKTLLEEFSLDFMEEPPKANQVGGDCFPSVNYVEKSSVQKLAKASGKSIKYGCESELSIGKTHLKVEKSSEISGSAHCAKKVKNIAVCDSVLGPYEQKLNDESGENSSSIIDRGKKHSRNDEFSVNWSSDLFNLSDDEDEIFSVIKSPPHVLKASSPFKVPPVPPSVVSASFLNCIKPNDSTYSSVREVTSKGSGCTGLRSGCIAKIEVRTPNGEDSVVTSTKPYHSSDGSCLQSTRQPHSAHQNSSEHAKRCNSSNEISPGTGGVIPAQSRPDNAPSSSHSGPLVSINGGNQKHDGVKEVLVVVSPVEACRASEVMSSLRAIRGVRLVVYAASGSPSIPYCLGRDLCLLRISSTGLGRYSKASDAVQAAFSLFRKVTVIIEQEKEGDGAQSNWSKKKSNSPWNSGSVLANYGTSTYIALLNLRTAGVTVLHSSGLVETANLIAEIARHEQDLELQSNLPPVSLPSSFETSNPVLKFYASLPGLNTFQALGLFQKFPKINDFLARCTSARSIQMAAYLDLNRALQLHNIIANVHVSDT